MAAWKEAGLQAQFRSTDEKFKLSGLRKTLEEPEYEGTTLRDYLVNSVSVQVAELPSDDLFPDLPGGRNMRFRPGRKGRRVHLSRKGRLVLMVSTHTRVAGISGEVPGEFVIQVFEAFEKVATP